ncbi:hypothetical protein [Macrococcoides bohemicum]|uniref:hypothetical protein n=1 Tax=Macrococcoides bohemicum TaxID=1903056 RepID=UPI001405606E|nr:hypothetical protein [Macrococcus bohemicus]
MKLLIKMIAYTILATILITKVTEHVVVQQYILYFSALALFVVSAHEIIKYENTKGEN